MLIIKSKSDRKREREFIYSCLLKLLLEEEDDEKPNMARRDTAACLAFPGGLDPSPRHSLLKIKIQAIEDEEEDEQVDEDEKQNKLENDNMKVEDNDRKLELKKTDKQNDDGVISKKNVETNIRYDKWNDVKKTCYINIKI